jgi:sec-independent protein translocase protein TatC
MSISISPENPLPLLPYLLEIRRRLFYCFATVAVFFVVFCIFSTELYHAIALPLLKYLPHNSKMIATALTAPLVVPLKLAAAAAIIVSMPIILYQLWGFIAPALYRQERRLATFLLLLSTGLFYLGMLFAYFIIFPLTFRFLIGLTPPDVVVMPDIGHYLAMVYQLFFAFGASFEVPLLILVLVWSGVVHLETLIAKRPYFIVGAFIMGMIFTPPDVISQISLAIPLCLLFEAGIWLARLYPGKVKGPINR